MSQSRKDAIIPACQTHILEEHATNRRLRFSLGYVGYRFPSRETRDRHFVAAASSCTYGDCPGLPVFEDEIGHALSNVNELYGDVSANCHDVDNNWPALFLRFIRV